MNRNRGVISAIITFVQVIVLAAIMALSHGGAGVKAAGSVAITGTVTNQSGVGVQNVSVYATNPGGSTVEFGPITTNSAGSYELDVEAGSYDVHFNPPSGSGMNPVVESVTALNNQTLNVELTPITHVLSGIVTDANGNPVSGLFVGTTQGVDLTDANGHYSMALPADVYTSLGVSTDSSHPPVGLPTNFGVTDPRTIDLTNGDVTENVQLPALATVTVLTKDVDGNLLGGVPTEVFGWHGSNAENMSFSGNEQSGSTNASGSYTATVFQNSIIDAYQICANFPPSYASVCDENAASTTSGNVTVTLIAPIIHTLSGTVTDANGNPVAGVGLGTSQGSATTDVDGHYSMPLPAGVYTSLEGGYNNAHPPTDLPASFGFTDSQTLDLTNNDVTENVQLPPVATLTVTTNDVNGNPLSNVPVEIFAWHGPPTSTLDFSAGETTGRSDASGHYTTTAFLGSTFDAYQVCGNFPPSYSSVCNENPISTVGGNAATTLTAPVMHTLSGTITDANGNPVPGISVGTSQGSATTDATGHYSMTMPADVYTWLGAGYYGSTPPDGLPVRFGVTDPRTIDLTNGDATENIQLPPTATATVTAKDVDGSPLSGVPIEFFDWHGPDTANLGFAGGEVNGTTDASGSVTLTVFKGSTFDAYQICANFPPSYVSVCNPNAVSTTEGNITLVLQQSPPVVIPAAPTNLTTQSPAQNTALSWDTVSGATSYNIYRNGTKIDSTAATTYTDSTAAEGTNTYYVTAVNSAGESGQSNSVNVLVDRTAPTISYTLSSQPNAYHWYNSAVTVTFTCGDSLSGIATCPGSQTISTEGENQSVNVTATDNAGNVANLTVSGINIDETPPTVSGPSMSSTLILFNGQRVTVTSTAADGLSGIVGGEFYMDTDPGVGNGTPMTYSNGKLTATAPISGLSLGRHTLFIRAEDTAGNWSTTTSVRFTYIGL